MTSSLKRFLSIVLAAAFVALPRLALADKVAVLPLSSTNNVPKPELERVREWVRDGVVKAGHTFATNDEMVSAEASVRDGLPDTSQEYIAAGKAANAPWTVTARVQRNDVPASTLPNGATEEGYTTYRLELEACQVESGRVESVSREILEDDAGPDIAEMLRLLVRPEGLSNAEIPWERAGAKRPKPRPKPPAPPPPPPAPPPPAEPRPVYGAGHPLSVGAAIGVNTAFVRPDGARGPAAAMPVGGTVGFALESVPGLELKANIMAQALGPRALEASAGARWAFAPFGGTRLFVGPELLLGGLVALGADKTTRFLTHGSAFVAYGVTENLQLEVAGDLAAAFGGTGTLALGGGTGRVVVRF